MINTQLIKDVLAKATCLYSQAEVEAALDKIAAEMTLILKDAAPILLCVMNGAVITMGQLVTRLHFPLQIDYIHATRYQGATFGRELKWVAEPRAPLQDRTVVIIEDILDTGLTLAAIRDYCQREGAKAVYTVALVDKQCERSPGGLAKVDFAGVQVAADKFLIGYGLDYQEFLRNVPGIYAVAEEHK